METWLPKGGERIEDVRTTGDEHQEMPPPPPNGQPSQSDGEEVEENEDAHPEPTADKGTCERMCEKKKNSKQWLLAMCIGTTAPDGRKPGDVKSEHQKCATGPPKP